MIDLRFRHILSWGMLDFSVDSRIAICQLLAKEWALNTAKLPSRGLPRNSVVKQLTTRHDLCVYRGRKATIQTSKQIVRIPLKWFMRLSCILYIPSKKETHTVAFSNFLENNNKFSYFIYTVLKCVNRAVYPMNFNI